MEQIKQRLYVKSPFDLASDEDDAYRDGVDEVLSDKSIIRAINTYDELVVLLKEAHNSLRTFRNVPQDEQMWTSYDNDVITAIEKALAKAQG